MKLKKLVLASVFLCFAAVTCVHGQFNIMGSVSGRVRTPDGGAARRVSVTALNLTTLELQTRATNDFGYFRFENLPIVDMHLIQVWSSKRYYFSSSNQLVRFTNIEHNVLFMSDF